jgi:hypothetical protein
MADDGPDERRDERIAEWLAPEPLDEVTRRRLIGTAMREREREPAASPSAPSRAWRWIATAAAIVVVLVAGLAVFTAQGGNQQAALNDAGKKREDTSSLTERASPRAASAPPVDVGDFGDLSDPANLDRLRTTLEKARAGPESPAAVADAGSAFTSSAALSTLACRDQLPAGTVTAVGSGTLDGRRAVVVLTDLGGGDRSIDAVLDDPCEVRPLS